ncbi:unnamed protein product [Heterobilharzia americana]|nr:unnamed protein product [Heterobilharzia americana]
MLYDDYSLKVRPNSFYEYPSTKQSTKIKRAGSFNCVDSVSYENNSEDWPSHNYRHFPRFIPTDKEGESDEQLSEIPISPMNRTISPLAVASSTPKLNHKIPITLNLTNSSVVTGNSYEVSADVPNNSSITQNGPYSPRTMTPTLETSAIGDSPSMDRSEVFSSANIRTIPTQSRNNAAYNQPKSNESNQMNSERYLKSSNILIVHAEDKNNDHNKDFYPQFSKNLMTSYKNYSIEDSPLMSHKPKVQLIYAKPPKLRRDLVKGEIRENVMPLKMHTAPVCQSAPRYNDSFISKKVDLTDTPEQKYVSVSNQFGTLNDSVDRVILRLLDSAVVPGGALRGVVYIMTKKPVKLQTLTVTVEMITKTLSADEKQDMEKRIPISYTVLSDDKSIGKRAPLRKFTYQQPEFMQSPIKEADFSDPCFSPYTGPVLLAPGDHAIPFAFPLEGNAHPSILLRGKVGISGEVEIVHRYFIYATMRLNHPEENESVAINSKNLNFKVVSCGPLDHQLSNGDRIPAIMKTFTMQNRQMLIQIDSVVLQDSDDINIYIFTDDPTGIRYAEAYLLRIFHIPGLKVSDTKALYKLKKYPPNVFVDAHSDKATFIENFPLPFSEAAEAESGRLFSDLQHLPNHYRDFRVSCESLNSGDQSQRTLQDISYKELPRDARRAGCHLILGIPVNSVPQSCLEALKITYYVRVLIHDKHKVIAYSLPISVVEQRAKDYKMRYLGEGNHLFDPEYLKLKRDSRCAVS